MYTIEHQRNEVEERRDALARAEAAARSAWYDLELAEAFLARMLEEEEAKLAE